MEETLGETVAHQLSGIALVKSWFLPVELTFSVLGVQKSKDEPRVMMQKKGHEESEVGGGSLCAEDQASWYEYSRRPPQNGKAGRGDNIRTRLAEDRGFYAVAFLLVAAIVLLDEL